MDDLIEANEIDSFIYDDEGNIIEDAEDTNENDSETFSEEDSIFYDDEGNVITDETNQEESENTKDASDDLESGITSKEEKSDMPAEGIAEKKDEIAEKILPPQPAQNPDSEFLSRIKPDYIPGSKEFFDAVEKAAVESFIKETGEEFDEYDVKHMTKLSYFIRRESAIREKEYDGAIHMMKQEQEAKVAEKDLSGKLDSILNTPELKHKFAEEMNKISVSTYRQFEKELASGNFNNFLEFAAKVKNPPAPAGKQKTAVKTDNKTTKKTPKVELLSDFIV